VINLRRRAVHTPARPCKTLGGGTPKHAMQRLLFKPEESHVATTA